MSDLPPPVGSTHSVSRPSSTARIVSSWPGPEVAQAELAAQQIEHLPQALVADRAATAAAAAAPSAARAIARTARRPARAGVGAGRLGSSPSDSSALSGRASPSHGSFESPSESSGRDRIAIVGSSSRRGSSARRRGSSARVLGWAADPARACAVAGGGAVERRLRRRRRVPAQAALRRRADRGVRSDGGCVRRALGREGPSSPAPSAPAPGRRGGPRCVDGLVAIRFQDRPPATGKCGSQYMQESARRPCSRRKFLAGAGALTRERDVQHFAVQHEPTRRAKQRVTFRVDPELAERAAPPAQPDGLRRARAARGPRPDLPALRRARGEVRDVHLAVSNLKKLAVGRLDRVARRAAQGAGSAGPAAARDQPRARALERRRRARVPAGALRTSCCSPGASRAAHPKFH